MEQLKWTERKFDFGFRKEYLPFMLERIKSTAPRIEELMKNISEEKATNKQTMVGQRTHRSFN
jgi:hypothetical protein